MAFNKTGDGQQRRRPMHRRKKVCVFCGKMVEVTQQVLNV